MAYLKNDGSDRYNKQERGGWYCTNPKKHEDMETHHAAHEPHEHRAERNDAEPVRQPKARQTRQPVQPSAVPPTADRPTPQPTRQPAPQPVNLLGCVSKLILLIVSLFLLAFCTMMFG